MSNYPYYAEIEGKQYPINTDFRVGLACFKAIEDPDLSDIERGYALVGLIFGEDVEIPNSDKTMEIIGRYLSCDKTNEEHAENPLDMDFEYDASLIATSILHDYNIDVDLDTTKLHWWKYCELINGLTDKTILNRVRDIRNMNLAEIEDPKTKNKVIKAKKSVSLPVRRSKEEKEAIDEFESQLN